MQTEISCTFSLISSSEIEIPDFRGNKKLVLALPITVNNLMGYKDTVLKITDNIDNKYQITIISKQLNNKKEQIQFTEKISEYISFLINRDEVNPSYGNIFAKIDWFNFKSVELKDEPCNFKEVCYATDGLSITLTRTLHLFDKDWCGDIHSNILRFYFDGLRAEHKKSKYFHWFLVLEYLENSKKYKKIFSKSNLFDENESSIIKDAASKMSSSRKKGTVENLLLRTEKSRNAKLLELLIGIGITSYNSNCKTIELTENIIKTIIDGRNSIFHSGSSFPDSVLLNDLFPLSTLIVEQILINKKSID